MEGYRMANIKCFYVSGASIVFTNNENNSAFIASVLPTGDQYKKKEIVAIVDNKKLTEGVLKRDVNQPNEILLKFTQWGANPEDVIKMSDFFKNNLDKEDIKEKETSIEGGLNTKGVSGKFTKKIKK